MKITEIERRIIFEDNHLLVINKPAGILVQGDKTGDKPLVDILKEYLKKKYNKPGNVFLAPAHRLDRPVSGVVIFPKTSKAFTRVAKMFHDGQVMKTYVAVGYGKFDQHEGTIESYLLKNSRTNTVSTYQTKKGKAKLSKTTYRLLYQQESKNLMVLHPKTGRSHQLRVHMSSLNIPILGDLRYGAKIPLKDKSIALHSLKTEFLHPVRKEKICFRADLPNSDIWLPYVSLLKNI